MRKPDAHIRIPAKTTPLLQPCDIEWPEEAVPVFPTWDASITPS